MKQRPKQSAGVWLVAQWENFGLPFLLVVMVVVFAIIAPAFASVFNLVTNVKFSATVIIQKMPASRLGDSTGCGGAIIKGDFTVLTGG